MKNTLLFNFLKSFATSNPEKKKTKTLKNLLAVVVMVMGMGVSWGQTSTQNFGSSTASLTSSNSASTIPSPSLGTTYARIGTGSGSVNIANTSNPIGSTGSYLRAAAPTGTSVNKATPINGYTASTEFYTSFKVLFGDASGGTTATSGSWTLAQGSGAFFSDNNAYSTTQTFTGLRFTYGLSGALSLTYDNGSFVTTGLTNTSFSQGTVYTIEIVGNNKSSGTISYTYNGAAQTLAVQKFDLFINGTKIGDDLTWASIGSGVTINGITLTGISSASNAANIFLDDVVTYNAVPTTIGTAAPTVTSIAATSLTTTSATLNGNVTSDGGAIVTERGFVYKTSAGATISDNKTTVTGTTGAYTLTPTLLVNTLYFFKAYAINSVNTTLSTPELSFYTLANAPGTPTVNNPTTTSLNVTINANSNPSSTEYAIEAGGNYVQANGTLSASAVWQTATAWGTKTVTSLSPSTTYTFKVKARNGANTDTAFSATASASTSASSTPTISGGATAAAFTTTYGTESGVQTFAISGTNLTSDITTTAPTGFLVSSDGSNYGATATFSQVGGTVSGLLRIKLAATAPVTGSYNSQNIVLSATGATYVTISTSSSGNSVTAAVLTVTGLSTTDKIYNRTTSVVINGTAVFSNLQNGESFTPNDVVTWAFADALVGTNKTLTRTGTYAAPSSNYTVTQPSLTATISALTLTTSGTASVITKTYDRNTTATITGISLVGVISPDVVIVSGTYNDKTVNTGKAVTLSLSGSNNANYTWSAPSGVTGNITAVTLTVTSPVVTSKPFDGNTSATITGTLSGVLVGDTVTFNGTGTFVSSAIANGISVTSTATLSGADAGNYTLTQPTGLFGNITELILATWNFTTNVSPTSVPTNLTISDLSQGNNNGTTTILTTTSVSSGYTGASGTNNAGAAARTGALNIGTNGSAYFEFTITPASEYYFSLTGISLGSRSTSTGPVNYSLRSSLDSYASDLATSALSSSSTWTLYSNSSISSTSSIGSAITYRIYGYNGTGSPGAGSANWRIDDLNLIGKFIFVPTNNWTGGTGNWSTASNWSLSQVPLTTDNITISSGSPVLDVDYIVSSGRTLTISGTGGLTINFGKTLTIAGTADFGGKAVTIKSNATGNGSIGQVTGTLSGATNVTVERYIPAKRSWRAITAPVSTTTSIYANWQENGTGNTVNGFDIWNPNGGTGILTGGSGSSLLSYSSSANTWSGVTNTQATSTMMDGTKNKPFMAFVTGPNGSNNIASGATATTIRATGTLLTGDQSYPTVAGKYAFVGNPYASPLDLTAVLNPASNATASFGGNVWIWDANVLGTNNVGTYNLFDFAVGNYSNISNNGTISNAQIQSGQAFFVKSTDGAAFAIKEAHKGSVWNNAVFRTAAPELLRVNLFKQINNEWAGRDGAMEVILADANANQIANKMINGNENIAFIKNGALFASEHHLPLVANDVLNVRVWKTTAGTNYKLKINTEQFATTNLSATLEDLFTNARTPLTLDGSAVEYPFTVTAEALSTGDRFRIVFQPSLLSNNIPKSTGFSIVPNPVTGDSFQVNLGSLSTGTYSYSICNAIGQEVEKGSINNAAQNTNYEVKMSNSATGIYFMKIKGSDNSVFTAKIIKK